MEYIKKRDGDQLAREIGSDNRYQQLAGKAVEAGMATKNQELVDLGSELARLAAAIPFSDDRFFKVINIAEKIEKALIQAECSPEKRTNRIIEHFQSESPMQWDYSLQKKNDRFCIVISNYRFHGSELNDPSYKAAYNYLRQILKLDALAANETKSVFSDYDTTFDTEYKAEDGTLVCKNVWHTHEDGVCFGSFEEFYFDNESEARKAWSHLAKIISEK